MSAGGRQMVTIVDRLRHPPSHDWGVDGPLLRRENWLRSGCLGSARDCAVSP